jgi:hypothetical protein
VIKLIVGTKGYGKTKNLIEMINLSVERSDGHIVLITKGSDLKFQVDHNVRLIDVDMYNISGIEQFYGFIAGILSSNYDTTEIYIDRTLNICNCDTTDLEIMLKKIDKLISARNIDIVLTVSVSKNDLPENISYYAI